MSVPIIPRQAGGNVDNSHSNADNDRKARDVSRFICFSIITIEA